MISPTPRKHPFLLWHLIQVSCWEKGYFSQFFSVPGDWYHLNLCNFICWCYMGLKYIFYYNFVLLTDGFWMETNINILKWPSQSHDVTPIDNMCWEIKTKVLERRPYKQCLPLLPSCKQYSLFWICSKED